MNKKKWIYGLILIGLLVRLYLVFNVSVWWDEKFSINTLTSSWIRIISGRVDPVHPPGYYLLLKMWSLISKKVVWLRLMSVLFYGLNSWLLYKIGKKVKDDSFALILLAGYCFSGYFVTFDWQIRMYSGLLSFILGSIWWSLKEASSKNLVIIIGLNALGLWFDYGFFWYFLSSAIYWLIERDWKRVKGNLLTVFIFGMLWGRVFFENISIGLRGIAWLKEDGITEAWFFVPYFLGWVHRTWFGVLVGLFIFWSWGLIRWMRSKTTLKIDEMILFGASSSLLFCYLISMFLVPLLHVRSLQVVGLGVLWTQSLAGYVLLKSGRYRVLWIISSLLLLNFGLAVSGLVTNTSLI